MRKMGFDCFSHAVFIHFSVFYSKNYKIHLKTDLKYGIIKKR